MSNPHHHSSPLPSCFHPTTTTSKHRSTTASQPISGNPNLTTSVYHTNLGLFALTWSRTLLGHSLHLHLLLHNSSSTTTTPTTTSLSSPSFHLHIKPFIFWNKHGSKKLNLTTTSPKSIQIFWDFSKAKFGPRPEPQSGFYIAAVVSGEMTLLVGDSPNEAYSKSRATKPRRPQVLGLRREHVYGNKLYTTKATIRGKSRDISIDCRVNGDDPKLYFSVDQKRVLQVKHLKWKFRGNERIEVDGVYIQVSWDVYNWLFDDDEDGYALFMFRFEKLGFEDKEEEQDHDDDDGEFKRLNMWSQQSCGFGFEKKKMKKGLLRTAKSSSSSSSSLSSASSCSSVMEWASVEENELKDPSGFSLLVYAWKN
ncbi:hypothetical protein ACSBR1_040667 [Camellia fascicularis]